MSSTAFRKRPGFWEPTEIFARGELLVIGVVIVTLSVLFGGAASYALWGM